MAKVVFIIGESGDGKTTSIIVPKDGIIPKKKEELKKFLETNKGMPAESTVIVNCDGKDLPFPAHRYGWKQAPLKDGGNLFTSTYERPITADWLIGDATKKKAGFLDAVNNTPHIKAAIIDTINGSMNDKEMLETKGMSWDKWYDLAKDFYALISKSNSMREDLVIYLFGHVALQTTIDGSEEKTLLTNGKKLEKIKLHTKVTTVLTTNVSGMGGDNKHVFETQKNKSIAKSPLGMFDDFTIPNSLKLVDETVRNFYGI